MVAENITAWCLTAMEPCDQNSENRVDGSCNNLKHTTMGTPHTPFRTLLPLEFSGGQKFEPRLSCSGNQLPLARKTSTSCLQMGTIPDQQLTMLSIHFLLFSVSDYTSLHDTVNTVVWTPDCCYKNRYQYMCAPNPVPPDDCVHRFSGCRCMNQTKPLTYQSQGCTPNGTVPARMAASTPFIDLSSVYGNFEIDLMEKGRLYENGFLKYEMDDQNRMWPPSDKNIENTFCYLNQLPYETTCFDIPDAGANSLVGINIFMVLFWRFHNYIAAILADLNPCWNDEKLFWVTRRINVACFQQILFYELLPLYMGLENLINDEVISSDDGYRDMYDEDLLPQMSLECPSILRWIHTMQEGGMKMYDLDGCYLRTMPIVNCTLRSGYLVRGKNMQEILMGGVKQTCAQKGPNADPDLKELALGGMQANFDLFTADVAKLRDFGLAPYYKYKLLCLNKENATKEEIFADIKPEFMELLSFLYEDWKDIDLLVGTWFEESKPKAVVPPMLYCIFVEQCKRMIYSDRFFFERPSVFTLPQLLAIRKITVASLLCTVGYINKTQRQAFLKQGPGNEECNCDEILRIDLSPWKDAACDSSSNNTDSSDTGSGSNNTSNNTSSDGSQNNSDNSGSNNSNGSNCGSQGNSNGRPRDKPNYRFQGNNNDRSLDKSKCGSEGNNNGGSRDKFYSGPRNQQSNRDKSSEHDSCGRP